MTWMRAIGGPAHDCWIDVPKDRREYVIPITRSIAWTYNLDPLPTEPAVNRLVYTVVKLVWPGFRFPIRALFADGVAIKGHPEPYDNSWPNPLVPARCRCDEIEPPFIPWSQYQVKHLSACHLDHCPIHGRWTFPPITPTWVSEQARDLWRFQRQVTGIQNGGTVPRIYQAEEQRDTGPREIETGADPAARWNQFMGREP